MSRLFPMRSVLAAACGLALLSARAVADSATVTIDVSKPGTHMPPMFYGLMTEEINHAYDGGLYAELIQNRTFQDDNSKPAHWSTVGAAKVELDRSDPVNAANPVCLRVDLTGEAACGAANSGFWGIPVKPQTQYAASFYAKGSNGFAGPVTATLVGDDGTEFATATSEAVGSAWKKYTLTLKTADAAPTKNARFALSATGTGSVHFNLVSLFPPTYLNTPGGLRADLMKMMAAMKPSFVRLPGGNYLEGTTFATRFDWKKQIGPVDLRPGHQGCWNYRSSDGMGLTQMLLWCRQLNAEPVLGLFAGYVLNRDHVNAGPDMQPFVDEALEEIEYVTGGPETKWGKQRIADGLTEPFKLTYVEIGNEDWFDRSPSYDGRFTQMFDAIRAKYPNLKIMASAPVKSRTPDLYDDHFYQSADAMVNDSNHYDKPADPNATSQVKYGGGRFSGTFVRGQVPDVFCGEWASQEGKPTPNLKSALADAVWLMGLERNADLVKLECYAPLFVNVNPKAWQWGTNLIGYDAMGAFGSPSYYAQALFGQNKVDRLLPVRVDAPTPPVAAVPMPKGAVGLGAWHTNAEYKDLSVTDADGKELLGTGATGDLKKWSFNSPWTVSDGVLRPAASGETWGTIGDPAWTDYTIKVKARKVGGAEGFIVMWHAADAGTYNWWNIGGWNNSRTQAEAAHDGARTPFGPQSKFLPEVGKWYDLRLEVKGRNAKCFVDDKLIIEANDAAKPPTPRPLHVSAGLAAGGEEIIVKLVNYGGEPIDARLDLAGVKSVESQAKVTVLSGQPRDVNTIDAPTKVVPKEETLTIAGPSVQRTLAPYSLTVLRLKTAAD